MYFLDIMLFILGKLRLNVVFFVNFNRLSISDLCIIVIEGGVVILIV